MMHQPAKFGGHRRCGGGDIIFLVDEEEHSRWSDFNLLLQFITTYHINNSDPCHMYLNQQLGKNLKITFVCPSENTDEKEKKKQNDNCEAFWFTRKRNQPYSCGFRKITILNILL